MAVAGERPGASAGVMAASSPRRGIAIIGMAGLFPGAPDVDAYWRNILAGVDATSDPPPEAWDPDVYYDPDFIDKDRTYCKRGGYLGAMARFDPLAHGIPPISVGGEPDQWLALQVACDALADAGDAELPQEVRARTAVIFGKGTYLNGGNAVALQRGLVIGQTLDLIRQLYPERSQQELEGLRGELQRVLPPLGPETVPGLIPNIIVGRIANRLDLMGPAYTVDAACASSLVAVQHAVRDLLAGDCDLALAGGSQVWMPVATLNLFCRLGALSRRQQLRAFDKDADGTLLSEGIGAVVLKRADDALRDGDRVYAVIRGVGVASDGRGMSVMAPRVEGEELALRRAYAAAEVSPDSIGLIEAHGTGTPVGDVTEVQALTRVFGEREGGLPRCALGTVKSMIGHTIPAAGVAGLIKTALALHHRVLPPTLACEQPNPELGLERTQFYINTETRPWIHGGAEPRRAGINAFGFGGINAHAVLEEWDGASSVDHRPAWDSEVCILEGDSPQALADAAGELAGALEQDPELVLADLAFTLSQALGGTSERRRLAVVATSPEDLRQKLGQAIEKLRAPDCRRIKTTSGIYYEGEPLGREGKVVYVFPGEGAQYPNMLADLCLQFDEARAVFDRIDRIYAQHPRGHLLSDWVFPRPAFSEEERRFTEARLMELDIAVEAVLTANAAVYEVIRRLVPRCDAMLGHSTGEHSAAMAAGALDVETDERLGAFSHGLNASYADAAARHEVPAAVLLALGTDAASARRIGEEAGGELYLAMDNCPHQAVLVGEAEAAARAREIAIGEGLMCEQLPYDRAVHTPMFAPFAEDLRPIFAELPVRGARTPLWSCTTAAPYPEDPDAIRELLVEHWTQPVRLRETIEALHDDGARIFVEVGPRGNMTSFVQDILRGRPACAVAPDLMRRSGTAQLNHLVGMLAVHDVELDFGFLFAQRDVHALDWRHPAQRADGDNGRGVALSTSWPMLRLPEEALERLRPLAAASTPATASTPAAASSAAAASTPAAPSNGSANGHAAPPLPPTDHDEVAAALDGYMQTMEHFLMTNEHVMSAYLGGGAAVAVELAPRPLVGTVVAWEPEVELVAQRIVDPAEDRYLLDHTLGRMVSRADPGLHALALMPLAMSVEILAEGASCLLPDLIVTGLRDLRAHRWLAFGETPKTLELSVRRLTAAGGCERV
jgi:acyl transferase domain-containing protein